MTTFVTVSTTDPLFSALCPRCNRIYDTETWGAPWECPKCAKTGAGFGRRWNGMSMPWGAGS